MTNEAGFADHPLSSGVGQGASYDPVAQGQRMFSRMTRVEDRRDQKSYIYVIAGDGTPVKIGRSVTPYERLAALQTAHWQRLSIVAKFIGGRSEEAALHARFAVYRLEGEWFARTSEIDDFIVEMRDLHGAPEPYHLPIAAALRARAATVPKTVRTD